MVTRPLQEENRHHGTALPYKVHMGLSSHPSFCFPAVLSETKKVEELPDAKCHNLLHVILRSRCYVCIRIIFVHITWVSVEQLLGFPCTCNFHVCVCVCGVPCFSLTGSFFKSPP